MFTFRDMIVKKGKSQSKYLGHISPISGHSMVYLNHAILVLLFGFNEGTCSNDIFTVELYDKTPTIVQKKFKDHDKIPKLASPACCTDPDGNIFVYGGTGPNFGNTTSDKFFKLNFRDNSITQLPKVPNFLSYGSTLIHCKDSLYLFGGTNGEQFFNQLWNYSLDSQEWSLCTTSGSIPCGRYKHYSVIYNDYMYVIGGAGYASLQFEIYKINLKTLVWEKLTLTTNVNTLYAFGASHTDHCVYLLGGLKHFNDKIPTDTFYTIDLRDETIKEPKNNFSRLDITNRCFSACTTWNNSIYIYGGSTGKSRKGDLWEISI
jgi:N-acetylneuraminic acid mutarotase